MDIPCPVMVIRKNKINEKRADLGCNNAPIYEPSPVNSSLKWGS